MCRDTLDQGSKGSPKKRLRVSLSILSRFNLRSAEETNKNSELRIAPACRSSPSLHYGEQSSAGLWISDWFFRNRESDATRHSVEGAHSIHHHSGINLFAWANSRREISRNPLTHNSKIIRLTRVF
jgi:hypothetical protein